MGNGRPGGIRTPNTRIWSPVLYQFELLACKHDPINFYTSDNGKSLLKNKNGLRQCGPVDCMVVGESYQRVKDAL